MCQCVCVCIHTGKNDICTVLLQATQITEIQNIYYDLKHNIKCTFKILSIRLVVNVYISYSVLIILHNFKKKKKVNLKMTYYKKNFYDMIFIIKQETKHICCCQQVF